MTVTQESLEIPARLEPLFPPPLRVRLLELRRDLHRHPELAFAEERTAARLAEELARLKPVEISRVAGTGVVARLKGRDSGAPAVAVRGDMDALPIQEETGFDFTSVHPGVMHACGHDVHATWVVGAACLLAEQPARGDVLVVLQPAEETGKGARAILESGALEGVAAIFGAHVDRRFEVGQVVAQEGPIAASSDKFEIQLLGQGAHGARPHEAADPIVAVAALIGTLQTIVSRRVRPGEPAVVSVGSIQGGRASNVIPDRCTLTGTLRAVSEETREILRREVQWIARATAEAHHLQVEIRVEEGTPPLVNPAGTIRWARKSVAHLLGEEALVPLGTVNLGGEDFAHYLETMTGCYLRIGAREAGGEPIPAHSSRFYAAEGAIFVGAAVLAELARVGSKSLAR